jgi:hypothetical protein
MVGLQTNILQLAKITFIIILVHLFCFTSKAQLVVDNTFTPQELVQDFF